MNKKDLKKAYVGLGGNLENPLLSMQMAIAALEANEHISELCCSHVYSTTPVTPLDAIAQPSYLNAVCCFLTSFSSLELFGYLKSIEKSLGKAQGPKNAPRIIDLDLLFFEEECSESEELTLPHPKWKERLFVLVPLLDLTSQLLIPKTADTVELVDLRKLYLNFVNIHHEQVIITPYKLRE